MGIARRTECRVVVRDAHREFVQVRLAGKQGAGIQQDLYDLRIRLGPVVLQRRGTGRRRQIARIDIVLHRQRYAGKHAESGKSRAPVEASGRFQYRRPVGADEGIQLHARSPFARAMRERTLPRRSPPCPGNTWPEPMSCRPARRPLSPPRRIGSDRRRPPGRPRPQQRVCDGSMSSPVPARENASATSRCHPVERILPQSVATGNSASGSGQYDSRGSQIEQSFQQISVYNGRR